MEGIETQPTVVTARWRDAEKKELLWEVRFAPEPGAVRDLITHLQKTLLLFDPDESGFVPHQPKE